MQRQILGLLLGFQGLLISLQPIFAQQQFKAMESIAVKSQQEMLYLLVDKSKLQADLLTLPEAGNTSERLMSFKIAVGKEEGDKQKAGDNKTPEGIYFAQRILNGKSLGSKYGPFAIPIDFPNPLDRFLGKTGYGIWLHGVQEDNRIDAAKVTEGCVAFYNADIESLTQWVVPDQSVIVIAKDAAQVNRPEVVAEVRNLTQRWIDAWAQRDADRYISLYHPKFQFEGKGISAYYKYKKRVFASYTNMKVAMEDIRVVTHDRYAVAIMNQDFNGDDRYRSYGRKVLYWQHEADGQWKLFHEEHDQIPIQLVKVARDKLAQMIKSSPSTKALQENVETRL